MTCLHVLSKSFSCVCTAAHIFCAVFRGRGKNQGLLECGRVLSQLSCVCTGSQVVVKELALGRLKSWKQLDLFEREASTVRGLSLPAFPSMWTTSKKMAASSWFRCLIPT